jgi:hypothetical protein
MRINASCDAMMYRVIDVLLQAITVEIQWKGGDWP